MSSAHQPTLTPEEIAHLRGVLSTGRTIPCAPICPHCREITAVAARIHAENAVIADKTRNRRPGGRPGR